MKFRLLEDLEDDLIQQKQEVRNITSILQDLFSEAGFIEKDSINGIAFENKDGNIRASFYIDDNLNYKGYVNDDTENSTNLSVKGNINQVVEAANKIINEFNQITAE